MLTPEREQKFSKAASQRQRGLVLVFENITDPHNIQAAVRTADAFGVQDVHVIFASVPERDLKAMGKSSSSSANKWVDYTTYISTKTCLDSLHRDGYTIYATSLDKESENFHAINFLRAEKVALLFGNEHAGLTDEALSCSDTSIHIPMRGITQSLNLSVTVAVSLYEVVRQRQTSKKDFSLSRAEQQDLIRDWALR